MGNLKDTEKLYNCLSSKDKLRVWNLLLPHPLFHYPKYNFEHPVIAADLAKVLPDIKQRSIFMYLNEFAEVGLITKAEYGQMKIYYFTDNKKLEFIQNIIDQINDTVLLKDWINFSYKYRGFSLLLSKLNWKYNKQGKIKVYEVKSYKMGKIKRENIVIGKWLDKFSIAVEHKEKDQIQDMETALLKMNVTWGRFPKKYNRYKKLLEQI